MRDVVAVDAGGTASRAVVVDEEGSRLGSGRAGGGNPTSVGFDAAAEAIAAAISAAVQGSGHPAPRVRQVLLAHAGGGGPAFHAAIASRLAVPVRITAVGDLAALFASGTPEPDGVAVIAGTGAIGGAVRGGAVARLVDGTGWLLGDAGSGFWIGHRVARAVVDDLGGGAPTALTTAVLDALGIEQDRAIEAGRARSLGRLVRALYEQRPVELSRLAPIAFTLAPEDEVAATIVAEAVAALTVLLTRVRSFQPSGPVVLGGSVLVEGVLRLPASRIAALLEAAGTTPIPVADGLVGAAVLALRAGGVEVDGALFERLRAGIR